MSQTQTTPPSESARTDGRPTEVVSEAFSRVPEVDRRPLYKRPAGIILFASLVLAGVIGLIVWLFARQWESTDDAFIDANIYPVSAKVAGQLQRVLVSDNQTVQAGDVLAEIDPRDIQARLAQARAALEAAKADAHAARTNVELTRANTSATTTQAEAGVQSATAAVETARSQLASAEADVTSAQAEATRREADEKRLMALDPRAVSQTQIDAAHAAADAARAGYTAATKKVAAAQAVVQEAQAKVSSAQGVLAAARTANQQIEAAQARANFAEAEAVKAQAAVDAAALEFSYTTIKAPASGRVTRKNIQPGQYILVGQTLLAVVPPDFWVTANFKETQLTRMRVGQPVEIEVDAYPGHTFRGRVQSMQAGTGARFSLLPPENATGNFVKVVQRVPVKIVFDADQEDTRMLSVGMSVVPSVHVSMEPDVSSLPTTQNASPPGQAITPPSATSAPAGY